MLKSAFASRRFRLITVLALLIASVLVAGFAGYTSPARAATVCNHNDTITLGKFYLMNNLWGAGTGSGSQCLSTGTLTSPSVITWSTSYNWSGQTNTVKSYDAAIVGWHWGFKVANTGLPVQLSTLGANKQVVSNWLYDITQNTTVSQNVAYDMWFHTNPNAGNVDPTDEVMIWLYKSGSIQPVGTRQGTVNMGGVMWELWRGTANTWNVFTYVSPQNLTTGPGGFNLSLFITDLVIRGGLQSSKYLMGVEAGTEVFLGTGTFNVRYYSLDFPTYNNPTSSVPTNTAVVPTRTPTRASTANDTPLLTQTALVQQTLVAQTRIAQTRTAQAVTRVPTRTATTPPTRTPTQGSGGTTCSPVNATITAPFTFDGAGTFCWRSNNLGGFINSHNLVRLTINGVNMTNMWVPVGSYPAKAADGYWYIVYESQVPWGHFEAQ